MSMDWVLIQQKALPYGLGIIGFHDAKWNAYILALYIFSSTTSPSGFEGTLLTNWTFSSI